MNKFETMKQVKDGLAVLDDLPTFAREGFAAIPEDDLERLKWAGIFHRKPTRPFFMMRIRFPGGVAATAQLRVVADILARYGRSIGDLTTRQQIEPRWLRIEDMPAIRERLASVGLTSLQTGMDNIRGVVSCPLSGLYAHEIADAAPLCAEFQNMFVGDRAFTNLPRKFNVAITGCPDNCVDAESQDVALVPAVRDVDGAGVAGFNVLVGGKMGSGGFRSAEPLDVFVRPEDAARICRELVLIFRDFGPRETRSRARFAFLIEERGLAWVRAMAEERMGNKLFTAGTDSRTAQQVDHVGVTPQRQAGLNAVGLVVPVGRFTAPQLCELARLADAYGRGEIRLTVEQNLVIPHVPGDLVAALLAEPLVREWTPEASPALRGLISCTGTEFCNLALIETKARALEVARALEGRLPDRSLKIRWSGCPAACGNHHVADIGLQGKRIRLGDGRIVEAVTISAGGKTGPGAQAGTVVYEDVVCDERLPELLAQLAVAAPSPMQTAACTSAKVAGGAPALSQASRIREGIRPPKFADRFARLDYEARPMPVIALYPIPETIALSELELTISGLDCKPRRAGWRELSHLPRYQLRHPLICQIFNWAEVVDWEGVRLADVLTWAGVEQHADGFIAAYSRDGIYFEGLSMAEARDPRVLLATGLNGEPLPTEYGGPLRLVVPFLQGYKSVKWLGAIHAFRHDPVGIKRLLAQSKIARLAPPWQERFGIVPPEGPGGDPDPGFLAGEPMAAGDIAPAPVTGLL